MAEEFYIKAFLGWNEKSLKWTVNGVWEAISD